MNKIIPVIVTCFCLFVNMPLSAQIFNYGQLEEHPRLLFRQGEEQRIEKCISEFSEMQRVYDFIREESDRLLIQPTLTYAKTGKRLLPVSREALKRIFYLSFMHRMTHDEKYHLRAEQEITAVCSFQDWNPSHFLDTGEMTLAVAIGYDWLYKILKPTTRELVQDAIRKKGFAPSRNSLYNGFLTTENNWNQVCNTGMAYGALAIMEDHKEEAIEMIERAMSTIGNSIKGYAPDGNYPEGYNYWGYGTTFSVLLIAALESSLGTDGGLSQIQGFMDSARYMEYCTGTTGLAYNYSDARETTQALPALFWFASKMKDPSLLWNEKLFLSEKDTHFTDEEIRFLPIALIYGSLTDIKNITPPASKIWVGHGVTPVALIHTDWEFGKGCFVGVKGGTASASHAHMDAGSFVFEASGIRWAQDLGMQDYYSLEKEDVNLWDNKQNGQRWDIFRYNNFTHNTLSVNGEKHLANGFVPITKTYNRNNKLGVTLDLTALFGNKLKRATRDVILADEKYLLVTDRIQASAQPAAICWTMVTSANPKILNHNTIELTQQGKTLHVIIESPSSATFRIADNTPVHSYDSPNPGSRRILIDMNLKAGQKETLKVKLVP